MEWYYIVIGYLVLYFVIWLHEIGHSIFYWKYGLKKNWLNVNVKPYIFFSTPGEMNLEVWNNLDNKQYVAVAYAGIAANTIFAFASGIVLITVPISNTIISVALWLFLTLHVGEIFSYLFIGSIYLVSDMAIIAQAKPKLRVPNIIVGFLFTVVYVFMLMNVPSEFKTFVIV